MSIQMIVYEGFLAADPEMRYTKTGKGVTNFRMGSNHVYKNSDGVQVKETTWLKVACWGPLAEIVNQRCRKGSHVVVTGRLRVGDNGSPSVYKLSSGDWAASYEITADAVSFQSQDTSEPAVEASAVEASTEDIEIPF